MPSFVGERGVCPQLAHLVGEDSDDQHRWQSLLESGCRTGTELARAWESLQREAKDMTDYLGEELEGVLAMTVEGFGEGSTDGSTRRKVVERREKLRGSVIGKALELHPDQLARPVLAWPQLDKLSSAWLLAYPGPHSGLPSTVFTEEAISAFLALHAETELDRGWGRQWWTCSVTR